jgi:M-phase inducer tyrosine phosphatase
MDVDQSMTMPEHYDYDVNLSSPPPMTLSARASNADFSNLFFDDMSPARKTSNPDFVLSEQDADIGKQGSVRFADYQQQSSSPAPQHSSPMQRKYERFASTGGGLFGKRGKPTMLGLGVSDIPEKKRPRRPTISALMRADTAPESGEMVQQGDVKENSSSVFPLGRRAVSDAAAHLLMDSGDPDASTDTIPELSSPAAQVVAKRAVRTLRRRDGADDLKPIKNDLKARLERASPRALCSNSPNGNGLLESPSARWFKGAGLPGFGDNEAHGKVLPCHRVPEDGLMRINVQTVSETGYGLLINR